MSGSREDDGWDDVDLEDDESELQEDYEPTGDEDDEVFDDDELLVEEIDEDDIEFPDDERAVGYDDEDEDDED